MPDPLKDLLAKGDKAIARAERDRRPKSDPPESDWDMDTARHEIEELKEAVKRAPLPSSPEINVNVHLDSRKKSDPPESVRSMFSKKNLPRTVASIVIAAGAVAAAVAQACQGIPHP